MASLGSQGKELPSRGVKGDGTGRKVWAHRVTSYHQDMGFSLWDQGVEQREDLAPIAVLWGT